jgi:peptidoglycan/xylan/chitin deacetylase (PgdA/CDA1 family)
MQTPLTIAMYHYVRPLRGSKYPGIKGLEVDLFERQIRYFKRLYSLVSVEDVLDSLEGKATLPKNAMLLTFDDGYIDHYEHAFPILAKYGIRGAFYPPAQSVTEHRLLAPNKVHFILAASNDQDALVKRLFELLDEHREQFGLKPNEWYFAKLAKPNRFDTAEVIFIKRLLQVELPPEVRGLIADILFEEIVGVDEETFARALYMNEDQLREMLAAGQHIGVHGYRHDWLGSLTPEEQALEIDRSLKFLLGLGVPEETWTICYPYGDYNDSLLGILAERGCRLGMTSHFRIADLAQDHPLTLPRLDTNDFPREADAAPNALYEQLQINE